MEYRTLGWSGLRVPTLCVGTMNFGGPTPEDESVTMLDYALERGFNFIDTADMYNNGETERILGRYFKANGKRDSVILASKVYWPSGPGQNDRDLSRWHIIQSVDNSLRRLQTDRIDLYQMHRPSEHVPIEETIRALDDLAKAGKILYIGTSTYAAWMVMEGLAASRENSWLRFISEQPPYNLLERRAENEMIPLCQKYNLAVLPWSPLAMGILAGRYPPGVEPDAASRYGSSASHPLRERMNDRAREIGATVGEMARERGLSAAQLALLWCKDQPGITAPIVGARTLAQMQEQLAVADMHLAAEDRPLFDALVHPGNAVVNFHTRSWWMKGAA